ncbi:MAG TPA: branched-chain amino acid ABC transporter permease [Polyangiaceae bacterium]|nr:branched-chain amino acid ABC transporter permease [Polyangiaceae bacterium]
MRKLALPALLVSACVLPFLVSDYRVFQLTLVIVHAIALLGLNLLTGYSGQISLGHGAFYAIGAYTAAILIDHFHVPYWATVPLAGIVCLGAGILFGLPAGRLENLYLALATFALGVSLPQILKYRHVEPWTGGVQGVTLTKPEAPLGLPLSRDQWLYYFSLAVMVVLFAGAWNLLRGHTGRAIVAIRDNPIAAAAAGIDVARYKSLTFGVSAMYTGIAGALGGIAVQFVGPDSFSFFLSLSLLVGIVVGGLSTISGAIYGALFIQFVPNIAGDISKAAPLAIYGVLLIAVVYVMPSGIAGAVNDVARRMRAFGRTTEARSSSKHRENQPGRNHA